MIHSEDESANSFTPGSQQYSYTIYNRSPDHNQERCKDSNKKYAVIDQSIRIQLLRRILSKQSTIKEAAKEFGINFSTAKAILQTYRKEGRIGKKKTRDRNKSKQDLEQPQIQRKIQSMYNLEREQPVQRYQEQSQAQIIMAPTSSPNLDNTQIALALCQRELMQQKLLNLQLMAMIQNFKNISQLQVKEEPIN